MIKKHVNVDSEKVQVKMDRGELVSMLEVDIEIPTPTKRMTVPKPKVEAKAAAAATRRPSSLPGETLWKGWRLVASPFYCVSARAHSAMYFAKASL